MKRHLVALVGSLCIATKSWAAPPCLQFDGDPVTLAGVITLETFFGHPNFGENPKTDSRETQAILVLTKSICVGANPATNGDDAENQFKVTLVPTAGVNLKSLEGRSVTVEGALFHANTGHHHTPVLMQVVRVRRAHE